MGLPAKLGKGQRNPLVGLIGPPDRGEECHVIGVRVGLAIQDGPEILGSSSGQLLLQTHTLRYPSRTWDANEPSR